jgi:hypothetical protein
VSELESKTEERDIEDQFSPKAKGSFDLDLDASSYPITETPPDKPSSPVSSPDISPVHATITDISKLRFAVGHSPTDCIPEEPEYLSSEFSPPEQLGVLDSPTEEKIFDVPSTHSPTGEKTAFSPKEAAPEETTTSPPSSEISRAELLAFDNIGFEGKEIIDEKKHTEIEQQVKTEIFTSEMEQSHETPSPERKALVPESAVTKPIAADEEKHETVPQSLPSPAAPSFEPLDLTGKHIRQDIEAEQKEQEAIHHARIIRQVSEPHEDIMKSYEATVIESILESRSHEPGPSPTDRTMHANAFRIGTTEYVSSDTEEARDKLTKAVIGELPVEEETDTPEKARDLDLDLTPTSTHDQHTTTVIVPVTTGESSPENSLDNSPEVELSDVPANLALKMIQESHMDEERQSRPPMFREYSEDDHTKSGSFDSEEMEASYDNVREMQDELRKDLLASKEPEVTVSEPTEPEPAEKPASPVVEEKIEEEKKREVLMVSRDFPEEQDVEVQRRISDEQVRDEQLETICEEGGSTDSSKDRPQRPELQRVKFQDDSKGKDMPPSSVSSEDMATSSSSEDNREPTLLAATYDLDLGHVSHVVTTYDVSPDSVDKTVAIPPQTKAILSSPEDEVFEAESPQKHRTPLLSKEVITESLEEETDQSDTTESIPTTPATGSSTSSSSPKSPFTRFEHQLEGISEQGDSKARAAAAVDIPFEMVADYHFEGYEQYKEEMEILQQAEEPTARSSGVVPPIIPPGMVEESESPTFEVSPISSSEQSDRGPVSPYDFPTTESLPDVVQSSAGGVATPPPPELESEPEETAEPGAYLHTNGPTEIDYSPESPLQVAFPAPSESSAVEDQDISGVVSEVAVLEEPISTAEEPVTQTVPVIVDVPPDEPAVTVESEEVTQPSEPAMMSGSLGDDISAPSFDRMAASDATLYDMEMPVEEVTAQAIAHPLAEEEKEETPLPSPDDVKRMPVPSVQESEQDVAQVAAPEVKEIDYGTLFGEATLDDSRYSAVPERLTPDLSRHRKKMRQPTEDDSSGSETEVQEVLERQVQQETQEAREIAEAAKIKDEELGAYGGIQLQGQQSVLVAEDDKDELEDFVEDSPEPEIIQVMAAEPVESPMERPDVEFSLVEEYRPDSELPEFEEQRPTSESSAFSSRPESDLRDSSGSRTDSQLRDLRSSDDDSKFDVQQDNTEYERPLSPIPDKAYIIQDEDDESRPRVHFPFDAITPEPEPAEGTDDTVEQTASQFVHSVIQQAQHQISQKDERVIEDAPQIDQPQEVPVESFLDYEVHRDRPPSPDEDEDKVTEPKTEVQKDDSDYFVKQGSEEIPDITLTQHFHREVKEEDYPTSYYKPEEESAEEEEESFLVDEPVTTEAVDGKAPVVTGDEKIKQESDGTRALESDEVVAVHRYIPSSLDKDDLGKMFEDIYGEKLEVQMKGEPKEEKVDNRSLDEMAEALDLNLSWSTKTSETDSLVSEEELTQEFFKPDQSAMSVEEMNAKLEEAESASANVHITSSEPDTLLKQTDDSDFSRMYREETSRITELHSDDTTDIVTHDKVKVEMVETRKQVTVALTETKLSEVFEREIERYAVSQALSEVMEQGASFFEERLSQDVRSRQTELTEDQLIESLRKEQEDEDVMVDTDYAESGEIEPTREDDVKSVDPFSIVKEQEEQIESTRSDVVKSVDPLSIAQEEEEEIQPTQADEVKSVDPLSIAQEEKEIEPTKADVVKSVDPLSIAQEEEEEIQPTQADDVKSVDPLSIAQEEEEIEPTKADVVKSVDPLSIAQEEEEEIQPTRADDVKSVDPLSIAQEEEEIEPTKADVVKSVDPLSIAQEEEEEIQPTLADDVKSVDLLSISQEEEEIEPTKADVVKSVDPLSISCEEEEIEPTKADAVKSVDPLSVPGEEEEEIEPITAEPVKSVDPLSISGEEEEIPTKAAVVEAEPVCKDIPAFTTEQYMTEEIDIDQGYFVELETVDASISGSEASEDEKLDSLIEDVPLGGGPVEEAPEEVDSDKVHEQVHRAHSFEEIPEEAFNGTKTVKIEFRKLSATQVEIVQHTQLKSKHEDIQELFTAEGFEETTTVATTSTTVTKADIKRPTGLPTEMDDEDSDDDTDTEQEKAEFSGIAADLISPEDIEEDSSSVDSFTTVVAADYEEEEEDRLAEVSSMTSSFHSDAHGAVCTEELPQAVISIDVRDKEEDRSESSSSSDKFEIIDKSELSEIDVSTTILDAEGSDKDKFEMVEKEELLDSPSSEKACSIPSLPTAIPSLPTSIPSLPSSIPSLPSSIPDLQGSSPSYTASPKDRFFAKYGESDNASVASSVPSSLAEFEQIEQELHQQEVFQIESTDFDDMERLTRPDKNKEQDNVSITSSLIEFESLEREVMQSESVEKITPESQGSVGAGSVSSLTEFERLEKELDDRRDSFDCYERKSLQSSTSSLSEFERLEQGLILGEVEVEAQRIVDLLESGELPGPSGTDSGSGKGSASDLDQKPSSDKSDSSKDLPAVGKDFVEGVDPASIKGEADDEDEMDDIVQQAAMNVEGFEKLDLPDGTARHSTVMESSFISTDSCTWSAASGFSVISQETVKSAGGSAEFVQMPIKESPERERDADVDSLDGDYASVVAVQPKETDIDQDSLQGQEELVSDRSFSQEIDTDSLHGQDSIMQASIDSIEFDQKVPSLPSDHIDNDSLLGDAIMIKSIDSLDMAKSADADSLQQELMQQSVDSLTAEDKKDSFVMVKSVDSLELDDPITHKLDDAMITSVDSLTEQTVPDIMKSSADSLELGAKEKHPEERYETDSLGGQEDIMLSSGEHFELPPPTQPDNVMEMSTESGAWSQSSGVSHETLKSLDSGHDIMTMSFMGEITEEAESSVTHKVETTRTDTNISKTVVSQHVEAEIRYVQVHQTENILQSSAFDSEGNIRTDTSSQQTQYDREGNFRIDFAQTRQRKVFNVTELEHQEHRTVKRELSESSSDASMREVRPLLDPQSPDSASSPTSDSSHSDNCYCGPEISAAASSKVDEPTKPGGST